MVELKEFLQKDQGEQIIIIIKDRYSKRRMVIVFFSSKVIVKRTSLQFPITGFPGSELSYLILINFIYCCWQNDDYSKSSN